MIVWNHLGTDEFAQDFDDPESRDIIWYYNKARYHQKGTTLIYTHFTFVP
jgi:hypothetical protein